MDLHRRQHKLALVLAHYGALCCNELTNLCRGDFKSDAHGYNITVERTKTATRSTFLVPAGEVLNGYKACTAIKQHLDSIPSKDATAHIFRHIEGTGDQQHFTNSPWGKNKLSEVPKLIAQFLRLLNANDYSSHTFRRTAATTVANHGATVQELQRAGAWKSPSVAMRYVEESTASRQCLALLITPRPAVNDVLASVSALPEAAPVSAPTAPLIAPPSASGTCDDLPRDWTPWPAKLGAPGVPSAATNDAPPSCAAGLSASATYTCPGCCYLAE